MSIQSTTGSKGTVIPLSAHQERSGTPVILPQVQPLATAATLRALKAALIPDSLKIPAIFGKIAAVATAATLAAPSIARADVDGYEAASSSSGSLWDGMIAVGATFLATGVLVGGALLARDLFDGKDDRK